MDGAAYDSFRIDDNPAISMGKDVFLVEVSMEQDLRSLALAYESLFQPSSSF